MAGTLTQGEYALSMGIDVLPNRTMKPEVNSEILQQTGAGLRGFPILPPCFEHDLSARPVFTEVPCGVMFKGQYREP